VIGLLTPRHSAAGPAARVARSAQVSMPDTATDRLERAMARSAAAPWAAGHLAALLREDALHDLEGEPR